MLTFELSRKRRWPTWPRASGAHDYVIVLFIAVAAPLFFRLPLGVDLYDEPFDFSHILDWMQNGFKNTPNLNIRQTSALLNYPIAFLYSRLNGGIAGIILFLRAWDVFIAMLASLALYDFLLRMRQSGTAALSAAIFFAAIPCGFPVPEYDDLGMYGFATALALVGSASLILRDATESCSWTRRAVLVRLVGSSFCWAFAFIANPPLVLVFLVFVGGASWWLPSDLRRRIALPYATCCLAAFAAGACLLLAVFGSERMEAMFEYSSRETQLVGGSPERFARSLGYLSSAPMFSALLLASAGLGVFHSIFRDTSASYISCAGLAFLVLISLTLTPALILESNDVCFLIGVFGVYLIIRSECDAGRTGVVRTMALTSFAAGFVYSWAAGMGILSVEYGLSLAACLALALLIPAKYNNSPILQAGHKILLILILFLAGVNSLFLVEGFSLGWPANRLRVESGPFMGLYTTSANKEYIDSVQQAFAAVRAPGRTVTVFGDMSALYLLADMAPRALSTYESGASTTGAAQMVADYYAQSSNQPDYIAINPAGEMGQVEKDLLVKYRLLKSLKVGDNGFMLYGRADSAPSSERDLRNN